MSLLNEGGQVSNDHKVPNKKTIADVDSNCEESGIGAKSPNR